MCPDTSADMRPETSADTRTDASADLPSDPALLSATDLIALYRMKALSPVEATRAALARIERHNGAVNASCSCKTWK